jgi:phosphatidylglycerol lysyltransferase
MMRHTPDCPNGTMDFLFISILKYYYQQGDKYFNLGFAPLSGFEEKPDKNISEKAIANIYAHSKKFFSFKGLHDYKAKYQPVWEDRFLVYQGSPLNLTKIALAIMNLSKV